MLSTAERGPRTVAAEDLAPVGALYEDGLCLRAYERAQALGPVHQWRGTAARILAGGLAANLGASRLGTALHVRAWREDPTDPDACLYRALALLTRRGPPPAWEFLRQVGLLPDAAEPLHGDWLTMHAIVLGQLRDFDAAESWLARAETAAAGRLVRRALRARPFDAPGLAILAGVARDERRLPAAIELYRLAACLEDKDEGLARTYFHTARYVHREEEALRFLKGRFRRLAILSAAPVRTLSWALSQLERMSEAFAVMDEAMRLRPQDGELLLLIAEAHAAHGEFDRAGDRLEAARGLSRRGDWLRAAASLASFRGDLIGSLALWRQVLEAEPLALDANRAVAHRLDQTEGQAAAHDHLARACDRFPHNLALHQAWIEWLRGEGPAAVEPAVRRIVAIHPADAWARRELALVLATLGRDDEAAAELRLATELEPDSTTEASVRGQVLEYAGRLRPHRRRLPR